MTSDFLSALRHNLAYETDTHTVSAVCAGQTVTVWFNTEMPVWDSMLRQQYECSKACLESTIHALEVRLLERDFRLQRNTLNSLLAPNFVAFGANSSV